MRKRSENQDPLVMVEVLVNGVLISGLHHANGKKMAIPKSQADTLASLNPPPVKIIGVP